VPPNDVLIDPTREALIHADRNFPAATASRERCAFGNRRAAGTSAWSASGLPGASFRQLPANQVVDEEARETCAGGTVSAFDVSVPVRVLDRVDILGTLVMHALEPMTVIDEHHVIAFENKAIERLTGRRVDERIGRSFFDFIDASDRALVRDAMNRALATREPTPSVTFRLLHRDGRPLPIESVVRFMEHADDRAVYGLIHSRDLGERADLQVRLRHAQKLTSLGLLTTRLADDVGRVVATIRSHLHTLRDPATKPVPFGLRAILKATEIAGAMAQQLRAFGELTPVLPDRIEIRGLLSEIRRSISDQMWLEVSLEADRTIVRAARESLQQGLTHLILGFRHAMPEESVVTITTQNFSLPQDFAPLPAGDPIVDYIVIEVTNTGRRTPRDVDGLLFEPSAVMPGSGPILMALVMLNDVVTSSGGFIEVVSGATAGPSVHIYIPVE
jgi:PAS domain S-box-containing protein